MGTPIRLTADFSAETLHTRRECHDIFKVMKGKNLQPRLLYPARISFRFDGKIKIFTDKQMLKEFITSRPTLKEKSTSLRLKENDTREKYGSTKRNEEHWKW